MANGVGHSTPSTAAVAWLSAGKSLWRNAALVNGTPMSFGLSGGDRKGNRGITIRLPRRDRLDIGGGADEH
ncbi:MULTISPECIES: hypothetical protein [Amycolatopsis]|uniref:hypothetical protein n=1 Tax=Amycolatopsis TaxID=1813 RepID=UPI00174A8D76|nr:hypothetical protein [Amycolatopsis bullii]